jgi:hypothetical protein
MAKDGSCFAQILLTSPEDGCGCLLPPAAPSG